MGRLYWWVKYNHEHLKKQRMFPGYGQKGMWPWKKVQRDTLLPALKTQEGVLEPRKVGSLPELATTKEKFSHRATPRSQPCPYLDLAP